MAEVVVWMGSPRTDGNTARLVEALARGAKERRTVEVIPIAQRQIAPCVGCNTCQTRPGHRCFRQDDMEALYAGLEEAETLVIASPVYFYGISAQLKAAVDRLHTPRRDGFSIRKLALVLVGGASLPELFDPILLQYEMLLRYFGLQDAGRVLVRGVRERGDLDKTAALAEAFRLGQCL